MKTITNGHETFTIPDYNIATAEPLHVIITEGEYKGTEFQVGELEYANDGVDYQLYTLEGQEPSDAFIKITQGIVLDILLQAFNNVESNSDN